MSVSKPLESADAPVDAVLPSAEPTTAAPTDGVASIDPVSSSAAAAPPVGVAGVAEPALDAPAPQARAKTKGVADLVFVVDVSGSMAPCIDALRKNIEAFIDSLSRGDGNNVAPVRDWRGKVVGFRDIEAAESENLPWLVDNAFVRDAGALKAQLAALKAEGSACWSAALAGNGSCRRSPPPSMRRS